MLNRACKSLFQLACYGLLLAFVSTSAHADDEHRINLKLFGKDIIGPYNGCHLAFWQANKNPNQDKYAYVFYAPYNDGEELPGWVEIGKTVFEFQRQDNVQSQSRMLEGLRLYRTSKGTYTMLMEVLDQYEEGDDLFVDKAKLTITRKNHFPFVITVKGGIFCPPAPQPSPDDRTQSLVLDGDPISLGAGRTFDSLSAVPRGVLNAVRRDAPDCDPANTTGYGARYDISGAMSLWEIPCNLYARSGSSVYVTSLNDNPDYSNVLIFPAVPDHGDVMDFYEIRNPQVTASDASIVSEYYDGDGTCGSYEAYQLRAVEGEAIELFLTEYREKPSCDGVQEDAKYFPLIYPVQ